MRPHASSVVAACVAALATDAEDNGAVAARAALDAHKAFRPALEAHVPPFLEFVSALYASLPDLVAEQVDACLGGSAGATPPPPPTLLIPASRSLRVLSEAPLQVMFLLNLYPRTVEPAVVALAPLMAAAVALAGPGSRAAVAAAAGAAPAAYADLKGAQVKTLSFLTYLLRQLPAAVAPHAGGLADALVGALATCPDAVAPRKELLVALRHALTTPLRAAFARHAPALLDEAALLGPGPRAAAELRPLAHSALAELVHHARASLAAEHLEAAAAVFGANLADAGLPAAVQCTSARLLLNLVEVVHARRGDAAAAERHRALLARALDAFVDRLASLRRSLPAELADGGQGAGAGALAAAGASPASASDAADARARSAANARMLLATLCLGMKTLLYSLTNYGNRVPRRPVVVVAAPAAPAAGDAGVAPDAAVPPPDSAPPPPPPTAGLRDGELVAAARAVECAVPCLALCAAPDAGAGAAADGAAQPAPSSSSSNRATDVYDSFADMFTVLTAAGAAPIVEIFGAALPGLYSASASDPRLLRVVTALAGHPAVARQFCGVTLRYLTDERLPDLADPASDAGRLAASWYAAVLSSLPKAAGAEMSLLPVLAPLVNGALALLAGARDKAGGLDLLLALFRALAACKSDAVHALFGGGGPGAPPLLPPALATLRALLDGPADAATRAAALECALSLPARLSDMLAVLPRLMAPLADALAGPPALASLGLRTLEYWVDSLNPEFLEPALAPVGPALHAALWAHLRPHPYPLGPKALALLGKLGGRGRRYLRAPPRLACRPNPEHGLRLILTFAPATSFLVPLDRCLALARAHLAPAPAGAAEAAAAAASTAVAIGSASPDAASDAALHRKRAAHAFLASCAAAVVSLRAPGDAAGDAAATEKLAAALFGPGGPPAPAPAPPADAASGVKTRTQFVAERAVAVSLLASLVGAGRDPDVPGAAEFAAGLARHFALLCAAREGAAVRGEGDPEEEAVVAAPAAADAAAGGDADADAPPPPNTTPTPPSTRPLRTLDPEIFLDAVVAALSADGGAGRGAALDAARVFIRTLASVADAQAAVTAAEGGAPMGAPAPKKARRGASAARSRGGGGGGGGGGGDGDGDPDAPPPSTADAPLDALLSRVLHACHGDDWCTRLGGAAALDVVAAHAPAAFVARRVADVVAGVLAAARPLPPHAIAEQEALVGTLRAALARALPDGCSDREAAAAAGPPLPADDGAPGGPSAPPSDADAGDGGSVPGSDGEGSAPAPRGGRGRRRGGAAAPAPARPRRRGRGDTASRDPTPESSDAPAGRRSARRSDPGDDPPPQAPPPPDATTTPADADAAADAPRPPSAMRPPSAAAPAAPAPPVPGLDPGSPRERAVAAALAALAHELFSPRAPPGARAAAAAGLAAVAERTGATARALLRPHADRLSPPLDARRLLPVKHGGLHAGAAAALAFCLRQDPPVLDPSPGLAAALADAASLVEADGGGGGGAGSASSSADGVAALRRACVDLLAAALASPPLLHSRHAGDVRDRAVKALFQQLTSPVAGDAAVADAGVARAAAGGALPKALLQAALRPVLVNVAYPDKLRPPLLRGLARLLDLLGPWFNATLGDKLVDHLARWLAPRSPGGGEGPGLPPGQGAPVAAAVLDLFHRLPPQASKFLASSERAGLVVLTVDLEAALAATPGNAWPTVLASPYRAPLLRFLCAHPADAAAYFLAPARVAAPPYYDRLLALLRMEGAGPLVDAVCGRADALLALLEPPPAPDAGDGADATPTAAAAEAKAAAGGGDEAMADAADVPPPPPPRLRAPPDPAVVRAHGVRLIALLAELRPGWLPDALFDAVVRLWSARARAPPTPTPAQPPAADRDAAREPARLVDIIIARARAAPAASLPALCGACEALAGRARGDHGALAHFLDADLPALLDAAGRATAVSAFVADAAAASRPPAALAAVADRLLAPILRAAAADGTLAATLADADLDALVGLMTAACVGGGGTPAGAGADDEVPPTPRAPAAGPPPPPGADDLNTALLRLATLLIRAAPDRLVAKRKELITFGWHHLKRDDGGARAAAFVAVSTFLDAYAAPDKVALQVFVALLRTSQADGRRGAAREALDVLTPALARRLPPAAGDRFPAWVGYVKKVLDEEAHSASHLAHVWGLVARHGPLFYPARGLFAPAAVAALPRLGLAQSTPLDNRKLALDLAALIVAWEEQRRAESGEGGGGGGAGDAAGDAAARKRARGDSGSPPDEPGKQPRREGEADVAGAGAGGAAAPTPGAPDAPPDAPTPHPHPPADYAPPPAVVEGLLSFLARASVVLAAEGKDADLRALAPRARATFAAALALWPGAPPRLHFVDKLVAAGAAAGLDPPPALAPGLDVLRASLAAAPGPTLASHAALAESLLERAFVAPDEGVADAGAALLAALHTAFPLGAPAPPREATHALARAHELLSQHLGAAAAALTPAGWALPARHLLGVCAACKALAALDVAAPDYAAKFVPALVRLLNTLARGHAAPGAPLLARAPRGADGEIVYGSAVWAARAALAGCRTRAARGGADLKKLLLQSLVLLITGAAARHADPALALDVLHSVRDWLLEPGRGGGGGGGVLAAAAPAVDAAAPAADGADVDAAPVPPPPPPAGGLTAREAVLFLQRLAALPRAGWSPGPLATQWDADLAGTILALCRGRGAAAPPPPGAGEPAPPAAPTAPAPPGAPPPGLARDVFDRVERVFLVGLRARDPETRAAFFSLYDASVPRSLFERLRYVVAGQDWEQVGGAFWLAQALDLLLAPLARGDPVRLAPTSSLVPPLLAGTRANFFSVAASQAAAAARAAAAAAQAAAVAAAAAPAGAAAAGEGADGADGHDADPAAGAAVAAAAAAPTPPPAPPLPAAPAGPHEDPPLPLPAPLTDADAAWTRPGVPQALADDLRAHAAFLSRVGAWRVHHLTRPLLDAAFADAALAAHLWVLAFPIAWATLADRKEQQVALAKPIIALLSREYHARQAGARPNVVQALLEGVSLSQPQPKIPSELVRYLGRSFSAWHVAVPLLESHVALFPQETRCFDALADLYAGLAEGDVLAGLWKRRGAADETRAALSLLQHGAAERAQGALVDALRRVASGGYGGEGGAPAPSKGEVALWVRAAASASSDLAQWDAVADYAASTDNAPLLADALAKLHDWARLKEAALPRMRDDDSAAAEMLRAYVALQEGAVMEGDARAARAAARALDAWWALPDVGARARAPLAAAFQRVVELQESTRALVDLGSAQRPGHQYSELKDILETWRLRTPDGADALPAWADVLLWRNSIYNVVITAFKGLADAAPHLHQLGYRDKAWSVNRLARVARKHGSPSTCRSVLATLYGFSAMEVQEAFVKATEQAKAALATPEGAAAGLAALAAQNLDYFSAPHQAELFRLRGRLADAAGDGAGAGAAFGAALALWPTSAAAWLSWGDHLWGAAAAGGAGAPPPESFVACYAQALRHGSARARRAVPRVLDALAADATGAVGDSLRTAGRALPATVWLPWLPQLLAGLARPDAPTCAALLTHAALARPQAAYCGLRTFLLSLREAAVRAVADARASAEGGGGGASADGAAADSAAAAATPSTTAKPAELAAFEAGKAVMDALRAAAPHACGVLEGLLTELGARFVPRAEERLLAVVHALLQRCYKLPLAGAAPVPASLHAELAGVCAACFSPDAASRHGPRMASHKAAFLADLAPDAPGAARTLGDLATRLKAWRAALAASVDALHPDGLRLEDESRPLAEQALAGAEMPAAPGDDPPPGGPVTIARVGARVAVVRRHCTTHRRLTFWGSDGAPRYFVVQTGQHWYTATGAPDERLLGLLRSFNAALAAAPAPRSRGLAWATPVVVPVYPAVRLLQEDPSAASYGEAYEASCARYGRDPDLPIAHFKKRCAAPDGRLLPDAGGEVRLAAYAEVGAKLVSENVFSQHAYKSLPSPNALWAFKRELTAQLGLAALLCHALLIGGRSPPKLVFERASGRVWCTDAVASYGARGALERAEPVPFRLTRNLVTFFTPFGVEGVFVGAMAVAAHALLAEGAGAADALALFCREDAAAHAARRGGRPPPASDPDFRALVAANAAGAVARVRAVAPAAPGEPTAAGSVQRGAAELVEAATSPRNLSRMEPTYCAWY